MEVMVRQRIPRTLGYNFENLFVFEMANNHTGNVEHGKRIIRECALVAKEMGVRAAMKLQFRELDTFIHPAHRDSKENKHISRFLSTRLSEEQFGELVDTIKAYGLVSMCTPFDEASVEKIERLGIEVIKIGSCSAMDRPLLEKVSLAGKPVIVSTGGLSIEEVDWVVTFLQKRAVDFALMHCVAIYPMPAKDAHLNQIEVYRNRYPGVTVGFSTHEDPANTSLIGLAYAKGARIFEKHVGIANPEQGITLNAYSATPEQLEKWIGAYHEAKEACGGEGPRTIWSTELRDLTSLMRGVYAAREIKKGDTIEEREVFFAIPIAPDQLTSGRFVEGLVADRDYKAGDPINKIIRPKELSHRDIIYAKAVHPVKGMLNEARVVIGHDFRVEISHHYGLERFEDVGCVLITCVEHEEYAKKIIVQLPGQWNPEHYHRKKAETFQILSGTLHVWIEGIEYVLVAGQKLEIPRGTRHSFGTETGCIFEEVSTKDWPNDSYYTDRSIAKKDRSDRKTYLQNWGRYQFD